MNFLSLLALLVYTVSPLAAHAELEDAWALPWSEFSGDAADLGPEASLQLLQNFQIGPQLGTYRVRLERCGASVQAVNLHVNGAAVSVRSFGVRFTDGNSREFAVNQTYASGAQSGWIDLGLFRAMDRRCPREVFAVAQSRDGRTATVAVYGNMR